MNNSLIEEAIAMEISVIMVTVGALVFLAVPIGVFLAIKYLIHYNAKMKAKYNA